jgi:tRNA threonylcarbamoyladenosine dehydratase
MEVHPKYERNLGFISEQEQMALGRARIAIAGAGGDGGALAVCLARMGAGAMGGEIRLADPEVFEEENLNRQEASTTRTLGVNKAEAVAEQINLIRPEINLSVYTEGVQPHNIDQFVEGADLLIDETEFTKHAIGVGLARAARACEIANMHILNVGFGSQITSYSPNGTYTLEDRLGLDPNMPIDQIAATPVHINRWLAGWPATYMHQSAVDKIISGERSAPSIAPGVLIAAGYGATQAALHIFAGNNHRSQPVWAPRTISTDAMSLETFVTADPLFVTEQSADLMRVRSEQGRNPWAGY